MATRGRYRLEEGRAESAYGRWPDPDMILSDGAYGVGGFPGDPATPAALPDWYRAHAACWSERATAGTVLWLWNTEIGWAMLHPMLTELDWVFRQWIVWDKGIAHVAGNVNAKTIRQHPVVTEICGLYGRRGGAAGPDTAARLRTEIEGNFWSAGKGARAERVHEAGGGRAAHANQKPMEFMRRMVAAGSEPGGTVWEPFGGLCSASVAAVSTGRNAFAAEPDARYAGIARERLEAASKGGIESATAASLPF